MPANSQNPFAPPEASLADHPDNRPGSPIKAIAIGFAVDIGGSFAIGSLLGIAYAISLAADGLSGEEIVAASSQIPVDSWLSISGWAVGLLFSILGGYVCARIAKQSEYRYGAILAILSALFGLMVGGEHYSFGLNASLSIAAFGSVLIGTRLGRARNRRPNPLDE